MSSMGYAYGTARIAYPENTSNAWGSLASALSPALMCLMNVGVSPFWNGSINLSVDIISYEIQEIFVIKYISGKADHSFSEAPPRGPPM